MRKPEEFEVTNKKPTWLDLRLLEKAKLNNYEAFHQLILRRTDAKEGELDEMEPEEVRKLIIRVILALKEALTLVQFDMQMGEEEPKSG